MAKVILPRLNQTGANEWADVQANDEAIATVVNGEISNENIVAGAAIARSKLEAAAQGIGGEWYSPKVIATEESRTNVAYGTLTTADEITAVVVPTNGKVIINYRAKVKNSVESAGRIAVFIDGNQLQLAGGGNSEQALIGTGFNTITTNLGTLATANENIADATTGQVISQAPLEVFVAAGTHTVGVRYKASSGSITAKERRLLVEVHGV
jgi:hypothetical protein